MIRRKNMNLSTKKNQMRMPNAGFYMNGVSSPTNLKGYAGTTVTDKNVKNSKSSSNVPFFYCAGISSPSAGNPCISHVEVTK